MEVACDLESLEVILLDIRTTLNTSHREVHIEHSYRSSLCFVCQHMESTAHGYVSGS